MYPASVGSRLLSTLHLLPMLQVDACMYPASVGCGAERPACAADVTGGRMSVAAESIYYKDLH